MQTLAVALAIAAFSGGCKAEHAAPRDAAPPPPPPGAVRGTFALTYYWVATEEPDGVASTTKLFDAACGVLATVSSKFAGDVANAGTGRLHDGRLVTVDGECSCPRTPCFRIEKATGWGIGAANRALVPFRSLAVDRSVIPIGTHLWIEELVGLVMPGGYPEVHDGCVVADDIGGKINDNHLDWFVGAQTSYAQLDHLLHLARVTVHDGGERCPDR